MQKQIDEKINKNPKLKGIIKSIRKKVAKQKNQQQSESENKSAEDKSDEDKTNPSAFAVSAYNALATSDYQLRDSYILDSGATIHVCNDRTRFHNLTPASDDDFLYTGNSVIPIKGLGTISITVQTPSGPRKIDLLNTAFIPSFHTNVVSLDRFIAKNVHWDTERNRLTHNGDTFCMIQHQHRQWVLEYNECLPDDAVFPARSAKPRPDEKVSPAIWHRRLGHPYPDAIAHLPEAVRGAKLDSSPSTIDCETCSVSKAHKLISRRPVERTEIPYERV